MLQMKHFTSFFLKFKSSVLVKRFFFLMNAAFAMAILDLISQVHLPSFVNMPPKCLKRSTFSSCFWAIIIVTGDSCFEIVIQQPNNYTASVSRPSGQHNRERGVGEIFP